MAIDVTDGAEAGKAFANIIGPYTEVYFIQGADFLQSSTGMSEEFAAMILIFLPIILFFVWPLFRWSCIGIIAGCLISMAWYPGTVITGAMLVGFGIAGMLLKRIWR
jgi:hypothetical protein